MLLRECIKLDPKNGPAMEIYTAIQKASTKAKEGVLQRLALATALVHAVPMMQRDSPNIKEQSKYVDPVKRYLSYEKWFLDGDLDPTFKDLSAWSLKMVVDGGVPNEMYAWGRTMMRAYRPDLVPGCLHRVHRAVHPQHIALFQFHLG